MKGAAILAASIAFCDRVVATTTAPTPSPKDDDDYNGSTALFVICTALFIVIVLTAGYLYSIMPKRPEPIPEEKPTPPDYEAQLLDLLREYRRIATEIRDVGQAMARRAWADTRQGQFWQEGESHFESHHGEIKEESNEDLTALLAKLKAELETVDGKIHALRAEGVGADIPDTLKLPEMDPEPELQTECADAACLTVDVA